MLRLPVWHPAWCRVFFLTPLLRIPECWHLTPFTAAIRLACTDLHSPVAPSHAQVSMNQMMETVEGFDGRNLPIRHIPGPEGVRGRNSDNALILEKLGWEPTVRLADGLHITYGWIKGELAKVCRKRRAYHVSQEVCMWAGTCVACCSLQGAPLDCCTSICCSIALCNWLSRLVILIQPLCCYTAAAMHAQGQGLALVTL